VRQVRPGPAVNPVQHLARVDGEVRRHGRHLSSRRSSNAIGCLRAYECHVATRASR
jgi:hypothetical protein